MRIELDRSDAIGEPLVLSAGPHGQSEARAKSVWSDELPDRWVVVGSHGGRSNDAVWAKNLRAHPDAVRLRAGWRWQRVHAHEARGEERARLWKEITKDGAYLHYEKTAAPRIIPLMVLTPRP